MKVKVGIFFGGPTKERELSFQGGRAVFDYLDRTLFEPVPIFVDSQRNLILLHPRFVQRTHIHLFYPPTAEVPDSPHRFPIYLESLGDLSAEEQLRMQERIGRPLSPEDLAREMDVAFLTIPGAYGGDGELQSLLASCSIPYTGAGVKPSEIGIDKALQRSLLQDSNVSVTAFQVINRREWLKADADLLLEQIKTTVGLPARLLPNRQALMATPLVLSPSVDSVAFKRLVNQAFSRQSLSADTWRAKSLDAKMQYLSPTSGWQYPIEVTSPREKGIFYHPEQVLAYLDQQGAEQADVIFTLEGDIPAEAIVVEHVPTITAFSCAVIQGADGAPIALLPMQQDEVGFQVWSDSADHIAAARATCEQVFQNLGLEVYARIDGYCAADGMVTVSGVHTSANWHPTAFVYQQAAYLNLSPSRWLSLFILSSLRSRAQEAGDLLQHVENQFTQWRNSQKQQTKIGVLLGGYGTTSALSIASGQHLCNLIDASPDYHPVPVLLAGKNNQHRLSIVPWPLLFREDTPAVQAVDTTAFAVEIEDSRLQALYQMVTPNEPLTVREITYDQLQQQVAAVFIALYERPATDGQVQMQLDARKIPYNGTGVKVTSLTFDRQRTLQKLKLNGLAMPELLLAQDASALRAEMEPSAYHFLHIQANVLSVAQANGAITCEVFPPAEANATANGWVIPPHFDKRGGSDQAYIEGQVVADLEKVAQVLQLEGCTTLEAFVQVSPSGKAETIIIDVKPLPHMNPGAPVFQQAAAGGYHPQELVAQIISFALAKVPQPAYVETGTTPVKDIPPIELQPDFTPSPKPVEVEPVATTQTNTYMEDNSDNLDSYTDYSESSTYFATNDTVASPEIEGEKSWFDSVKDRVKYAALASWSFLKSPAFLKNIGALLGLLVLLFVLFTFWLRSYTNHGESLQVHNYIGVQLDEARKKADSRSFSVVVIDSFFDPEEVPYRIYNQDPKPMSRVKQDRTIYLSVYSSTPKKKRLPTLVGNYDYSQYAKKLKHLKIKSKIKEQVFDSRLEPNTIMYLVYEGEKITDNDLREGVDIPEGSTVEFVVTKNQANVVPIPDLVCQRYQAGTFLISSLNLNLGQVYGEVYDRGQAYIWKQEPAYQPGAMIRVGRKIDIYLTETRPSECNN